VVPIGGFFYPILSRHPPFAAKVVTPPQQQSEKSPVPRSLGPPQPGAPPRGHRRRGHRGRRRRPREPPPLRPRADPYGRICFMFFSIMEPIRNPQIHGTLASMLYKHHIARFNFYWGKQDMCPRRCPPLVFLFNCVNPIKPVSTPHPPGRSYVVGVGYSEGGGFIW